MGGVAPDSSETGMNDFSPDAGRARRFAPRGVNGVRAPAGLVVVFHRIFLGVRPIFSLRRPRWQGIRLTAETAAGAANGPTGQGVGAGQGPAGGGPRGEKWRFSKWLGKRFEKNWSASNNHSTIVVGGLRLTGFRSLALSKASRRPPLCAETPCGLSCQHPRPAGGDAADDWSRVDCGTARADSRPAPYATATGSPSGPV